MNLTNTRTKILDAAHELVQRVGVNAMSYQDLSEIVGIRKASIHYHFPTKDDLIATLLDRYRTYVLELTDQIIAAPEPAETKLRCYCALFEATLATGNQDRICLGGMIGAELTSLNHRLVEQVLELYRANQERLATILTEGRKAGVFKFAGDINTMATVIFSLLEGGMLISRANGGVAQYRIVIEQMITLIKG